MRSIKFMNSSINLTLIHGKFQWKRLINKLRQTLQSIDVFAIFLFNGVSLSAADYGYLAWNQSWLWKTPSYMTCLVMHATTFKQLTLYRGYWESRAGLQVNSIRYNKGKYGSLTLYDCLGFWNNSIVQRWAFSLRKKTLYTTI